MKLIGTVIYNDVCKNVQMIISYYPQNAETNELYDYLTCLYPFGYGTNLPQYFVNEEDFRYIVHEGLETPKFDKFKTVLEEYIDNEKIKMKL